MKVRRPDATQILKMMRKSDSRKLTMFQMVRQIMEANEASRKGLPALEDAYSIYLVKLAHTEELTIERDGILDGVDTYKEQQRALATVNAVKIIASLEALAAVNGEIDLKEAAHITESRLKRSSRANFLQAIAKIVKLAQEHEADLPPFGTDQADTDELEALRVELSDLLYSTRKSEIIHKEYGEQIALEMRAINKLINDVIDKLMIHFATDDPAFFKQYRGARLIIKNGRSRKRKGGDDEKGIQPPERDSSPA